MNNKIINASFILKLIWPVLIILAAILISLNSNIIIQRMNSGQLGTVTGANAENSITLVIIVLIGIAIMFLIFALLTKIYSKKNIVVYMVSFLVYLALEILLAITFAENATVNLLIPGILFFILNTGMVILDIIHIRGMVKWI